ncbi:DUF4221 family protein [Algoriphagus sp.]|uniref:DUF4221 family protein n=1 Tax=Algoriphagus sp. TaxID=1872435 RepID=UPI003F725CE7
MVIKSLFYVYPLACILLVCSCMGRSENSNIESSIAIDTVLINTKSELLYLGDNLDFLRFSGLSDDESLLYVLDPENIRLILVDLLNNELESIIELEKEGPNGIGTFVTGFQVLNDSTLIIKGRNEFFFLNPLGHILKKIDLNHILYLDNELIGKSLWNGFFYKNGKIYCFPTTIRELPDLMIVYDSEFDSFEKIKNPYVDFLIAGSTVTLIGKSRVYDFPNISLSDYEKGVVLNSNSLPQLFSYSIGGHIIEENKQDTSFNDDVILTDGILELNGEEAYQNFKKDDEKKMKFFSPKWHESSKKFYRLGYRKSSVSDDYQNYLFVYDSSLKLVKISCVLGVNMQPIEFYLIDSNAFIAVSFYDDLGFLSFNINPFN